MLQKRSRTRQNKLEPDSSQSTPSKGEIAGLHEPRNVRLEISGQTARITMGRPSVLNALSKRMFDELRTSLDRVAADTRVRYAIITGSGSAFSAGLDISEVEGLKTRIEAKKFVFSIVKPFWRTLFNLEKPVIALVNGPAYGAGAEIALASDLVIASPKAAFAFSGGRVGALCCIAPILGPLVMQGRKVVEMNLTGQPISADEAFRLGLASSVVPEDKLLEEAERVISMMQKVSPISNSSFKRVRRGFITENLLDVAHRELFRAITGPDFRRGAQAFLAKQTAAF